MVSDHQNEAESSRPTDGSVVPLLTKAEEEFLAGTIDAETLYRKAYADASERARRTLENPAPQVSQKPSWLPPLSKDGQDFLGGRISAEVYIDRAHNVAERNALAELDTGVSHTLSIIRPVAVAASLLALAAILIRVLEASLATVLLATGIMAVLVILSVIVGVVLPQDPPHRSNRWQ